MSADTLGTPAGPYPATPAQHTAARIIGIIYPIQMATGIFGEVFVRGQLIARGDPTRTAQNIMASEQLFRFSIAGDLITYILVMVLTWALYVLLRPVNRHPRLARRILSTFRARRSLYCDRQLPGCAQAAQRSGLPEGLRRKPAPLPGHVGLQHSRPGNDGWIHPSWLGFSGLRLPAPAVALRAESICGPGNLLFVAPGDRHSGHYRVPRFGSYRNELHDADGSLRSGPWLLAPHQRNKSADCPASLTIAIYL
jgi:hypothetical protein